MSVECKPTCASRNTQRTPWGCTQPPCDCGASAGEEAKRAEGPAFPPHFDSGHPSVASIRYLARLGDITPVSSIELDAIADLVSRLEAELAEAKAPLTDLEWRQLHAIADGTPYPTEDVPDEALAAGLHNLAQGPHARIVFRRLLERVAELEGAIAQDADQRVRDKMAVDNAEHELATARRELAEYKQAVADQMHYDMQALLTGTPEERARRELEEAKAQIRAMCETMRDLKNYSDENERLRAREAEVLAAANHKTTDPWWIVGRIRKLLEAK